MLAHIMTEKHYVSTMTLKTVLQESYIISTDFNGR